MDEELYFVEALVEIASVVVWVEVVRLYWEEYLLKVVWELVWLT